MEKFLDRFAKRVVNAEYVNNFLRERDSEHMHRTLYLRFDVKERVRKKPPINELKEHQAEAEKEAAAKEAHQQAVKEQVSYNAADELCQRKEYLCSIVGKVGVYSTTTSTRE
jgi:hypothetical protein